MANCDQSYSSFSSFAHVSFNTFCQGLWRNSHLYHVHKITVVKRRLQFMQATLLRGHQLSSHAVHVGQGEQHVHLRKVLSDSPVAHLRMTPQTLDHQEGMVDHGPDARQEAVARALRLRQRAVPGATLVDVELNAAGLSVCLQYLWSCRPNPRASKLCSPPCNNSPNTLTSATLAGVPVSVCTSSESVSTPMCTFMPKYHCLPFLV